MHYIGYKPTILRDFVLPVSFGIVFGSAIMLTLVHFFG